MKADSIDLVEHVKRSAKLAVGRAARRVNRPAGDRVAMAEHRVLKAASIVRRAEQEQARAGRDGRPDQRFQSIEVASGSQMFVSCRERRFFRIIAQREDRQALQPALAGMVVHCMRACEDDGIRRRGGQRADRPYMRDREGERAQPMIPERPGIPVAIRF